VTTDRIRTAYKTQMTSRLEIILSTQKSFVCQNSYVLLSLTYIVTKTDAKLQRCKTMNVQAVIKKQQKLLI